MYCRHRLDNYSIVERTLLEGYYLANGLSGEGFKMSPIIGMMMAKIILGRWIRGETSVSPDLSRMHRPPMKNVLWSADPNLEAGPTSLGSLSQTESTPGAPPPGN